MKQILIGLLILGFAATTLAGEGYVKTGSKGIMRFVQVDKDKATDLDTYRRAIDDLCEPGKKCQVLFWTDNAPVAFPFSREQNRGKTAYWQYDAKSDSHRFYVDCKLFGTIEGTECI